MSIIIPCAGKSSRYPSDMPKYLRKLPDGEMLIEKVVKNYIEEEDVHIIILEEHVNNFSAENLINNCFKNNPSLKIHILDKITSGPAETVYKIVKNFNESILIRDCDSFFNAKIRKDNHIAVADLRDFEEIRNVGAKSFVTINEQSLVIDVFEKNIVSNYFCCGGYGFNSSKEFCKSFEKILKENKDEEIFISHVIKNMLFTEVFDIVRAKNYVDLGTFEDYQIYCNSN